MDEAQLVRQPLLVHLLELRKRLLWSTIIFVLAAGATYLLRAPIIILLQAPLHQSLYYSTPAGGLEFIMRVCVLAGLAFATPAFIYHLIKFIEPAVSYRLTRRQAITLVGLSAVLLVSGIVFAYKIILPLALHFFGEFNSPQIKPLISATDYLSFVLGCLLTFALVFQLPLIILFINRIKPLTPKMLMKYQRHVIIGSLLLALILPFTYDPLTQFVMALPIIVLYEFSIVLIWLANRHRKLPADMPLAEAVVEAELGPDPEVVLQRRISRPTPNPKHVSHHVLDLRRPLD